MSLESASNKDDHYLDDAFTIGASLAGLPALSFPAGFSNKLPIGMQLMGAAFDEARLLSIVHFYQQATNWHKIKPDTFGEKI